MPGCYFDNSFLGHLYVTGNSLSGPMPSFGNQSQVGLLQANKASDQQQGRTCNERGGVAPPPVLGLLVLCHIVHAMQTTRLASCYSLMPLPCEVFTHKPSHWLPPSNPTPHPPAPFPQLNFIAAGGQARVGADPSLPGGFTALPLNLGAAGNLSYLDVSESRISSPMPQLHGRLR